LRRLFKGFLKSSGVYLSQVIVEVNLDAVVFLINVVARHVFFRHF
jgi:hypothetical protein